MNIKRTMIDVSREYIEKNGPSDFKKVWKYVLSELKKQWKEENPNSLMKDIEEKKMSELHTLLTISGGFERMLDGKYQLAEKLTFNEIKVLKENVKTRQDHFEEIE